MAAYLKFEYLHTWIFETHIADINLIKIFFSGYIGRGKQIKSLFSIKHKKLRYKNKDVFVFFSLTVDCKGRHILENPRALIWHQKELACGCSTQKGQTRCMGNIGCGDEVQSRQEENDCCTAFFEIVNIEKGRRYKYKSACQDYLWRPEIAPFPTLTCY